MNALQTRTAEAYRRAEDRAKRAPSALDSAAVERPKPPAPSRAPPMNALQTRTAEAYRRAEDRAKRAPSALDSAAVERQICAQLAMQITVKRDPHEIPAG